MTESKSPNYSFLLFSSAKMMHSVCMRVCAASPNIASWGWLHPPAPLLSPRSSLPGLLARQRNVSCTLLSGNATSRFLLAPIYCTLCRCGNKCALACLATLPILPFHTLHTCCSAAFKRLQRKSARFKPFPHQPIKSFISAKWGKNIASQHV